MSDHQHTQDVGCVNPISAEMPEALPESVADLEEHRRRRADQAKIESMIEFCAADPQLQEILRLGLNASKAAEKRKAAKVTPGNAAETDEDVKPSTELHYIKHFEAQWDYRVGGVVDRAKCTVDRRAYEWVSDEYGAFWRVMSHEQITNHAIRWLRSRFPGKSKGGIAESCVDSMFTMCSFDPAQSLPRPSDKKVTILPVKNAYLFIQPDGTILAKQPDMSYGITHAVPAEIDWKRVDANGVYTPREVPKESMWGSYLNLFMSDLSARRLLQECTGASLLSTNFERAFMLVGGGSNGKSTYLNVLTAFHPKHEAMPLGNLDKEYELWKLAQGTTLAISSENVKFIGREAEQIWKSLISRDLISARKPFGDPVSFRSQAFFVAACNEAIQFSDRTKGLSTKVTVIPFLGFKDRTAKGAIRDFDQVVVGSSQEMAVVLDWALLGVVRLRQQGDQFSELSDEALEAAKAIRIEGDSLVRYLVDVDLRMEPAVGTPKDAIYDDYVQTMLDDNNKPVSKAEFWRGLREFVRSELEGELEEAQPSGGTRFAKRVSRIVNVSIRGVKPMDHRWKGAPAVVMPPLVEVRPLAPSPVAFVDGEPDTAWDKAMDGIGEI